MDALKDFDFFKVLFWIVPGAFMVLLRSFAMRGTFPSLSKDDAATLVLGSVVYSVLLIIFGVDLRAANVWTTLQPAAWFFILVIIPAAIGFGLGLLEASDWIGRTLRAKGIRFPSPQPSAWDTAFADVPENAVLIIALKDGNPVFGRWVEGSAASTDKDNRDLFVAEIGSLNGHGQYVANHPRRGAYIAAVQIQSIEIIG